MVEVGYLFNYCAWKWWALAICLHRSLSPPLFKLRKDFFCYRLDSAFLSFIFISLPGTLFAVFHFYLLLLCLTFLSFPLAPGKTSQTCPSAIWWDLLHHEWAFFSCHCLKCCFGDSFHTIFLHSSPHLFAYDTVPTYTFFHLWMTLKHFLEISFFLVIEVYFFRDVFFFWAFQMFFLFS